MATKRSVTSFKLIKASDALLFKQAQGLLAPTTHTAVADAVAVATAKATSPGSERWPVKTIEDNDAGKVGFVKLGKKSTQGIVPTTIEELVRMPRPADMKVVTKLAPNYQNRRASPVETTIWKVEADIIAVKRETDGDYHLVIQGASGETMIAESVTPKPPFIRANNPWLGDFKASRKMLDDELVKPLMAQGFALLAGKLLPLDAFSSPPESTAMMRVASADPTSGGPGGASAQILPFKSKVAPRSATIIGVGFFDKVHGQSGVAGTNGIELHPILKIVFH
jgi:hypothetical protein